MKKIKFQIGKKLKLARTSCGYTQEQVAELLGLAPRYIGSIETDKSGCSISALVALCNLYNVTLNDLFSEYLTSNKEILDSSAISGYFSLSTEHQTVINNVISTLINIEKNS